LKDSCYVGGRREREIAYNNMLGVSVMSSYS